MPLPAPETETLLYIDTATRRMMVGLSRAGEMVFQYQEEEGSQRYHSAILIPTLQRGLDECGLTVEALSGIGVNVGPGSFTGIRTGINTVRTMAQFLNVPVYGLNQFEILSAAFPEEAVAVYIDAMRGNIYHAQVRLHAEGPIFETAPVLLTQNDFQPSETADRLLVSARIQELFTPAQSGQVITLFEEIDYSSPECMARLVAGAPNQWKQPWQETFPLYLQAPNITMRKPQAGRLK